MNYAEPNQLDDGLESKRSFLDGSFGVIPVFHYRLLDTFSCEKNCYSNYIL